MPDTPNTISDAEWKRLQDAARKANPRLNSATDPDAIKARKASAQQRRNAGSN